MIVISKGAENGKDLLAKKAWAKFKKSLQDQNNRTHRIKEIRESSVGKEISCHVCSFQGRIEAGDHIELSYGYDEEYIDLECPNCGARVDLRKLQTL